MKNNFIKSLVFIGAAIMFMIHSPACNIKSSTAIKSVDEGATWEVTETTNLASLIVAEGAVVVAPEGHSITMTVNNVETAIEPGNYKGDIVLTVTDNIQMPIIMGGGAPPEGIIGRASGDAVGASEGARSVDNGGGDKTLGGGIPPGGFRAAIYVDGGAYVPEKSVPAAIAEGGVVTNNSVTDISISSTSEDFYGIIVTGDSTYSINDLKINFDGGEQGNYGYGITSAGNADVTINNASIITKGVQRAAIVVGGNSTIHVNNSYIEAYDGILPEHLAKMETSNSLEVPWVLGFIGNNRATNVVNSGTAYYNNTHIKAQRWGCLSTDAAQSIRLYATKCHLEAVESGYGAYSIGDTITAFDECTFNVPDYGLIMTGNGSAKFTNGTVVDSGRFGVLSHSGNVGSLNIDKGCVFNTEKAVIQLKSAYPSIIVDNAKLNSKNGIILEAIVNDDPWMSIMPGGDRGMGTPSNTNSNNVVNVTFRNMTLNGDIVNSMTSESDMAINFEKVTITGAITTASSRAQADIDGVKVTKKYYYYVGAVKNIYCPTDDKYGIKLSIDGKSEWVVDKTSFLTSLSIAEGAIIIAPEGCSLTMTVDGTETPIKAGTYEGNIVMTVAEGA